MSASIDIKIKQNYINLKAQMSPPATQSEGIVFLNDFDGKPKFREPNNGLVYNLHLSEYRGKNLIYNSNGDTNGLLYYLGTDFGKKLWSLSSIQSAYVTYSSDQQDSRSIGSSQLINRQEGFFSSSDYPDSSMGIQLTTTERILLKGIFLRAPNIVDYGFPINWNIVFYDSSNGVYVTIFEAINSDVLNGINKEVYIPISDLDYSVKNISILQTGLNSIGTNHLALGQIELYGKFM